MWAWWKVWSSHLGHKRGPYIEDGKVTESILVPHIPRHFLDIIFLPARCWSWLSFSVSCLIHIANDPLPSLLLLCVVPALLVSSSLFSLIPFKGKLTGLRPLALCFMFQPVYCCAVVMTCSATLSPRWVFEVSGDTWPHCIRGKSAEHPNRLRYWGSCQPPRDPPMNTMRLRPVLKVTGQ